MKNKLIIIGAGEPALVSRAMIKALKEDHDLGPIIMPPTEDALDAIKTEHTEVKINYNKDLFKPEPFVISALPKHEEPDIPRDKWGNILYNKSQFHK